MIGKGNQTGLSKRRIPNLDHRGGGRPAELMGVLTADQIPAASPQNETDALTPDPASPPPATVHVDKAKAPVHRSRPGSGERQQPEAPAKPGKRRFWLSLQLDKAQVLKFNSLLGQMDKVARAGARRTIGNAVRIRFLDAGAKPRSFKSDETALFELSVTLPAEVVARIMAKENPHGLQAETTVVASAISGYAADVLSERMAGIR